MPVRQARDEGHQGLRVRWVDVTKADGTHRSRFVPKDINIYNAPELSAATPPIDSLKYLRRCAAQDKAMYIMHADVTRAHFLAAARRGDNDKLTRQHQEAARRGALVRQGQ